MEHHIKNGTVYRVDPWARPAEPIELLRDNELLFIDILQELERLRDKVTTLEYIVHENRSRIFELEYKTNELLL